MKRLFSLLLLLLCSLTLCGTASGQQTWRLNTESSGYNPSHPQVVIDDSGRAWVAWLSDLMGNYDVYCSFYKYGFWQDEIQIVGDGVDQYSVRMIKDKHNGWIYAAWDSAGQVQVANYTSGWSKTDVADDTHQLSDEKCFYIGKDTLGSLHVAWSSPVNTGYGYQVQGNLRTYNGSSWDTIETILPAYTTSDEDAYFVKQVVCRTGESPYILASHEWDGLVYWNYGGDILFTHWQGDSVWANTWVDSWHNGSSVPIGISLVGNDTTLVIFCDNFNNTDSSAILCRRYIDSTFSLDTTYIIASQPHFHSGAVCNSSRPTLAWSDSHSIFLNTYYDTVWSHPPVQISDMSLHNCINPDIVAENDSTVWVCYQNDGDIYVTRTSVPLGVTGMPNSELRIAKPLALKAWPNPASNVIHFSYTLPNKRNSSVSIYDIAGRLVKTIEVKNDRINWNCADGGGRRVASGVYFARLRSDGQETIKKISIIK